MRQTQRTKRTQGNSDPAKNYRQPPKEHQFKPGKSGNPNGRPRKEAPETNNLGQNISDQSDEILLRVVGRPITVREGDRTETVPGMEALFRAMLRSAAQGDAPTARILLPRIEQAASRRAAFNQQVLEEAMRYLEKWNPIFYERELNGLPPPNQYPHPADIEIDRNTGQVTFLGPVTEHDAANLKALEEIAFEQVHRLSEVERQLESDPKSPELRAERKKLLKFENVFEQMGACNIRREVWRRARAAITGNSKALYQKPSRKRASKTSKRENE